MLQSVGIPGPVIDVVAGNVWKRRDMMFFAVDLAHRGALPVAVAIATASQWHNCHAFKWLLMHPNQTAAWLQAH